MSVEVREKDTGDIYTVLGVLEVMVFAGYIRLITANSSECYNQNKWELVKKV